MSDEETVVSGEESGGTEEKLVSMVEAMRYRKRAQAAEKELAELKEAQGRQAEELSRLKEQAEGQAAAAPEPAGNAGVKTRGVRETRGGSARGKLHSAAQRAAASGRRTDLQEYLRVRRAFV